ncbi:MAG: hypothetical protein LBG26_00495 [Treponema sp.]|jgi:hypothetical protein|nr:hypothetical protein [Treponema sp.]
MIETDIELLRLMPEIHRARGWRLYAKDGSRIVDLWQYGGRALLGHTPPGLLRALKNSAERGLFVPFSHFTEGRFRKALAALLPGHRFRVYSGGEGLGAALAAAEKVLPGRVRGSAVWRPFLDIPSGPLFIPVLPFPFPGAPAVLVLGPEADSALEGVLPVETVSPTALAAAARCIWDLIAVSPGRGEPCFPKLALGRDSAGGRNWRRQGIYLSYLPGNDSACPACGSNAKSYPALFRRFLDAGFLLPPSPSQPAILPGELSRGEEAKLAELLRME